MLFSEDFPKPLCEQKFGLLAAKFFQRISKVSLKFEKFAGKSFGTLTEALEKLFRTKARALDTNSKFALRTINVSEIKLKP